MNYYALEFVKKYLEDAGFNFSEEDSKEVFKGIYNYIVVAARNSGDQDILDMMKHIRTKKLPFEFDSTFDDG